MTNKGLGLAYVFAITNALIIGFSFLFTKNALAAADPLDTLAFRFIASFLVMSIPVLTGHIKLNYRGKPLGSLLVLALLYPTSFFTLQTFGLLHATSAEGGILIALTPVITMVLASLFLREKTNLMQKLSILLSVFGVLFIFIMQGGSIDPTHIGGIVLLLLSGFAISGYNVQSRSLSKQFTPSELSYVMMGFGFVLFLLVSVGKHIATGTMGQFFTPLANGQFVIAVLYLGIMSSLVTSMIANYVLSKIEAAKMSVFSNLSTVVSLAAGAIFLGEEVSLYHVIGAALIIIGVVGANRFGRKQTSASAKNSVSFSK
ncbi:EamA family transporter [Brevibacillus fluminis]|uniref:EamA family transporter n=1 Tax=Brevibacillus fluminis TaxID=511487 RepID=A0A3M8DHD2_9BACL|nr:DMT family transporter [Brevibacillus fluminis]RNB87009.1 EamA family transporter [Brevibacillus fluminis]